MEHLTSIALAVALALGGLPHAFCTCGCAGGPNRQGAGHALAACPHCRSTQRDDSGRRAPAPCHCHHCHPLKATAETPRIDISQAYASPWEAAAAGVAIDFMDAQACSVSAGVLGPPGWPATAGRSVPILLGRLLL